MRTKIAVDLKEEDRLGDAVSKHWYYRSKLAAVLHYLNDLEIQSILDVGAGSGYFSKGLLRRTNAREALCVDTSYTSEREECVEGKPVRFRTGCDHSRADLVLMMDVLEHVDDDAGFLVAYLEKVPIGTHFLITVPAFSFLWSDHDVFLDHQRRYTLPEIKRVVESAGLEVERGSYFYGLIFPLAAATRFMERLLRKPSAPPRSQLKTHSVFVNEVLAGICAADRLLLSLNNVAGLTAFCRARKALKWH